jgi:hypothetical protein
MTTKHRLAVSGVEFKFSPSNERTFEGYGAVFGNVDDYLDVIEHGAFAQATKSAMPKMFFNHRAGTLPVGKWTHMSEDSKGLLMVGELTKGNTESDNIRAAMLHGSVDGMSIGYMLAKSDYSYKNDIRHITNISWLREVSIVTEPANDEARIDLASVKTSLEGLNTLAEVEGFLRDSGDFSKGLATALVARIKSIVAAGDPRANDGADAQYAQLSQRLTALNNLIKI